MFTLENMIIISVTAQINKSIQTNANVYNWDLKKIVGKRNSMPAAEHKSKKIRRCSLIWMKKYRMMRYPLTHTVWSKRLEIQMREAPPAVVEA